MLLNRQVGQLDHSSYDPLNIVATLRQHG